MPDADGFYILDTVAGRKARGRRRRRTQAMTKRYAFHSKTTRESDTGVSL